MWCREGQGPAQGQRPAAIAANRTQIDPAEAILCRSCRAPVTRTQDALAVNGSFQHTFFNPAGIVFEICCFNRAVGCEVHGEPTSEFTWFAGHHWQYASCATCQVHLGWLFATAATSFFGLIRDRLHMPEE